MSSQRGGVVGHSVMWSVDRRDMAALHSFVRYGANGRHGFNRKIGIRLSKDNIGADAKMIQPKQRWSGEEARNGFRDSLAAFQVHSVGGKCAIEGRVRIFIYLSTMNHISVVRKTPGTSYIYHYLFFWPATLEQNDSFVLFPND